jgi:hypothetical protein
VSSLEIRVIFYVALTALVFAGGVKCGIKHVEAQWNVDKAAQAAALAKAQGDLTAALADRVQLQQTIAKQNETLQANSDALVSGINSSLRNVDAALRASSMFAAMANPGRGGAAPTGAASNSRIEQAFADVGASIATVSAACLHDARELQIIQSAAPH